MSTRRVRNALQFLEEDATMDQTDSIKSATILAFPHAGRREARAWGVEPPQSLLPKATIVDCDAWYHQAAVDEDKPHGSA
jgi:hypothetical protein